MNKQQIFDNAVDSNNIETFSLLLKDPEIDPSIQQNITLHFASAKGYTQMVKLLLNDKRVDPSSENNLAIIKACKYDNNEIINLLWNNKKVKITLKNDDLFLYNKLIKKDIKSKMNKF
jgi:hypothetical protein